MQQDLRRHCGADVPLATLIDFSLEQNFQTYAWHSVDEYYRLLQTYLADIKRGKSKAAEIEPRDDEDRPYP
jgi:hypothetical protein